MDPPRALGWGVGGGAMRKHVPAERMNELKHVPAKLGESKLGSTATTRRVKQLHFFGIIFCSVFKKASLKPFCPITVPKGSKYEVPGDTFWLNFGSFLDSPATVKIELSPARELNFEGFRGSFFDVF